MYPLRLIQTNVVPGTDSCQGKIDPADFSRLYPNESRQLIFFYISCILPILRSIWFRKYTRLSLIKLYLLQQFGFV